MTVVLGVVRDSAAWGGAAPEDIRVVCISAAQCFAPAISERPVEPIRVEPDSKGIPLTRFERLETGQVAIEMAVRGNVWSQLAFQFAHEFIHVLANFRRPFKHPTKWIEECLCEAGSLFALCAMARRWRIEPPYRQWADYADSLDEYASKRRADMDGDTFPDWLAAQLPKLELDALRRADNIVVASRLLPIFQADPEIWRAVRYLNLWTIKDDVPFDVYFETWRSVTPIQHHAAVDRIEQCLGLTAPRQ